MPNVNKNLFRFIKNSPTQFHAIAQIKKELDDAGFVALNETMEWKLKPEGRYYVTRNDSAIIAFALPKDRFDSFAIMASHSDSPNFKIKENPEMKVENHYVKLNVERYGGSLLAPWFDRPLSVAGRVILKTKNGLETRLVDFDRDLCMIVNLAIHMNREANEGHKIKIQKEMLPLISDDTEGMDLKELVAKELKVNPKDILGSDLFLYNRQEGSLWGANKEFISAPRLDDLQCAYASLMGFIETTGDKSSDEAPNKHKKTDATVKAKNSHVPVYCVFDNEEVGSSTMQGADSTFLSDTLFRINEGLGFNQSHYLAACANSFMISADNAQALHPNYSEKSCPTNRVFLNEGIAMKFSANQKYTTDGMSAAVFRELCAKAKVKCQTYVNNSDVPGGSTLGNISTTHVSMPTVDIGLPQLAMHSPYETAGAKDTEDLIRLSAEFYKNGSAN